MDVFPVSVRSAESHRGVLVTHENPKDSNAIELWLFSSQFTASCFIGDALPDKYRSTRLWTSSMCFAGDKKEDPFRGG